MQAHMKSELMTIDDATLRHVNGGFGVLPLLVAGGYAAYHYYRGGGGVNVGIANGNNNRVAVGNHGDTTQGDHSQIGK